MSEWVQTTAVFTPSRWRMILAIAWHDVRHIAKTPAVLATISVPVFMLLLFRVVFSGFADPVVLPVRVYDPGGSRVTAVLQQIPGVVVQQVDSEETLSDAGEDVAVVISVPPQFETAVMAGSSPDLFITLYPTDAQTLELAVFQQTLSEKLWASVVQPPINLVWQTEGSNNLTADQMVARFLLVFMMLMAMGMVGNTLAVMMVEEKNEHTLDSLLLSPANSADVLAGKGIAGVLYSFLSAVILIPVAGVALIAWPLMLLCILLGSMLMMAIGLLTGLVFETKMQCNSWGGLILLILFIPGWFLTLPIRLPWLETLIRLLPTYYLIEAMTPALNGEMILAQVVNNLAVVLLSIVILGWMVQWRAKRPFVNSSA